MPAPWRVTDPEVVDAASRLRLMSLCVIVVANAPFPTLSPANIAEAAPPGALTLTELPISRESVIVAYPPMPIPAESPNAPAVEPTGTFTRTWLLRIVDPLSTGTPSTTMPPPNAVASPAGLPAVAVLPDTNDLRIVPRTQPEVGLLQSSSPAMRTPPVLA